MAGKGNIEQFDNPINGLDPQSRGSEALAQEGRRVGLFYHQVGADFGADVKGLGDALIEHQTNNELAKGVKTATDMELQLEATRPQFFADNQGPDTAAKWQQHVQEVTSQWSSQFQTERGKLWAADRGTAIYKQSVAQGMGDQAEVDAAQNIQSRYGARQNHLAMIAMNPASADREMAAMEADDQQFRPALMDPGKWAEDHARFVQDGRTQAALEYYKSGMNSVQQAFAAGATDSPAYTQIQRDIQTGKYGDLIGEHLPNMQAELDEAKHRGQEQFRIDQDAKVKQQVLAGDDDFLSLYHSLNTTRNNGQPITKEQDDAITQYEKTHDHNVSQSMELERFRTSAARDTLHNTFVHSDGDVLNDMWRRASLPPGDPKALASTEVTAAIHDRKLSSVDGGQLLKEIQEGKKGTSDPQAKFYQQRLMAWAYSGIRSQLVSGGQDASGLGLGGGANPAGQMAWGEAQREIAEAWQGWLKTEKPAVAFDIMTNPSNSRNIAQRLSYWKAAAASGQPEDFFMANPNPDGFINQGRAPAPAAAPPAVGAGRQPGESPDAYLKRRGL